MTQVITAGVLFGGASVTALLVWATRGMTPTGAVCPACGQRQAHKRWCPHS